MTGFLAFITVMSFKTGPNTIMAMSEGQQKGFRKGLVFNSGILFGLIIIGGVISLFASIFSTIRIGRLWLKNYRFALSTLLGLSRVNFSPR